MDDAHAGQGGDAAAVDGEAGIGGLGLRVRMGRFVKEDGAGEEGGRCGS